MRRGDATPLPRALLCREEYDLNVSNFKKLDKNSLRGAFDLELASGICIYGAMLMESGGSTWISFAGIPTGEKDGKKMYKPVIAIPDRAIRDKFSTQVISALRAAGHIS